MKVVQIGDRDQASRRFSGHDLAVALRSQGIDANHLVWSKTMDDEYTKLISSDFKHREYLQNYMSKLNKYYSSNSLFYPFSYGLLFDKTFLASDVAHLHIIHNNYFDLSHLPILSRIKPLVWTLHDLWPIQGHCVHPMNCERWQMGCGDCPDLSRDFKILQDTSALNWEFKKLTFSVCDMDLIVASQWMYDRIKQSGFFPKCKLHLINFGLDLSIFKPLENRLEIREKLGIPEKNTVIAFRANNWIYKGFSYVKECLNRLTLESPITLLVFDEKGLCSDFFNRFQIIETGWVYDEKELVELYNASDIFLIPSVAESFGMMAIEGMACGKPVIVMDQTALPEIVKTNESGCPVVRQGDVVGLTQTLEKLIANSTFREEIGIKARKVSQEYYDFSDYIRKTITVYDSAIQRKKEDFRGREIVKQLNKHITNNPIPSPVFPLENVINVFPDSITEKPDMDGVSISNREFKLLKMVINVERTKGIQFILTKIILPIIRFFK